MEKLFYSIGEVAGILGESVSLVRFWSNSFPKLIKPQRNAKGNRQFSASDVETFKQIHHLVKGRGMTLEGAAQQLAHDRRPVDRNVRVIESLKEIRAQLMEIKKNIS